MKKALRLIAAFILGVIATLAAQYVCFCFHVPIRIFPPTAVIAPKSVSLNAGKMILVKTKSGAAALINLTSYGDYESESTYRWRFRSRTGVETKGAGSVKEKDSRGPPVVAGGIRLGWSYGSKTNCWLYYFEQDMTVQLLPDTTFDTEDLK
ncbi:MAG: hypothetical protein ABSA26_03205 [Thermoguttaceae bacterium]|jgi:hypothetical protein